VLILIVLDAVEQVLAFDPGIAEPVERRWGIGARDAVTQLADVVRIQVGAVGQSELLPRQRGESVYIGGGIHAAGIGWVEVDGHVGRSADRDEVDHHPIVGQQPETTVEVQVDGELGPLEQGGDGCRVEVSRAGDGDADPQDGDRDTERAGVSTPGEASTAVLVGDRPHPAVGLLIA